jgi:hypothetical protein
MKDFRAKEERHKVTRSKFFQTALAFEKNNSSGVRYFIAVICLQNRNNKKTFE